MALHAKVLLLFTSLCASASAAACVDDETSFVQVKQVVKHSGDPIPESDEHVPHFQPSGDAELVEGSSEKEQTKEDKEDWPTPVHDAYAITDSTPDHLDEGKVTDAFAANMAKAMDKITTKSEHDIEFTNAQRNARQANYWKARNHVKATEAAVASAEKEDEEAVAKTQAARSAAVKAALERVKEAKEDAEAHAYKKRQAEEAAVIGRELGTEEAAEMARESKEDMYSAWAKQDREMAREKKKAYLEKEHMMEEAAIDKATEDKAAAEAAYVDGANKWRVAAEAKSAADAAIKEEAIEGPEGMKNRITDYAAGRAIHEYAKAVSSEQAAIDSAAER